MAAMFLGIECFELLRWLAATGSAQLSGNVAPNFKLIAPFAAHPKTTEQHHKLQTHPIYADGRGRGGKRERIGAPDPSR